jgi:hypothetical protein
MNKLSRLLAAALAVAPGVSIEAAEPPKLPPKAESIILPKYVFLNTYIFECVQFFRKTSRELDPDFDGVLIALDAPSNTLPLVTFDADKASVGDGIRKLAEVGDLEIRVDGEIVHLKPKLTKPRPNPQGPSAPKLTSKAEGMIIPKVIFLDVSIRQCVDFFIRRSRDLDPEHDGVRIVLEGPEDEVTTVNLIANNASLAESLRRLTKIADLEVRAAGEVIYLKTKLKEPRLVPKAPPPVIPGLEPVPSGPTIPPIVPAPK